jgi:uncharacterized membrane protein
MYIGGGGLLGLLVLILIIVMIVYFVRRMRMNEPIAETTAGKVLGSVDPRTGRVA